MPDNEHPIVTIWIDGAAYDEPEAFRVCLTPEVLRGLADLGDLMAETGDGHYYISTGGPVDGPDDTVGFLHHVKASLS